MLEFNLDGSIKLSESQAKLNEMEAKNIVISREQINVKPAKAQIKIKFPADLQFNSDEIINFYHKIYDSQFKSVEHSISQTDARTFIIKVEACMIMYGFLNFMIECMKGHLNYKFTNQKVIVQGIWANYGKGSCF